MQHMPQPARPMSCPCVSVAFGRVHWAKALCRQQFMKIGIRSGEQLASQREEL
ncbi:hypothetical protein RUE5091_00080 [Ruegeria denitrificans]|uniref:Uncharacterized protein n=1 Tax=Ruegeria denitrificans TaxID=1715692 RepID=A0A0P1ICW5_9RHOB|nr:hypothetical protein RUE5091_00080 [Ruegeria denitrificans]